MSFYIQQCQALAQYLAHYAYHTGIVDYLYDHEGHLIYMQEALLLLSGIIKEHST